MPQPPDAAPPDPAATPHGTEVDIATGPPAAPNGAGPTADTRPTEDIEATGASETTDDTESTGASETTGDTEATGDTVATGGSDAAGSSEAISDTEAIGPPRTPAYPPRTSSTPTVHATLVASALAPFLAFVSALAFALAAILGSRQLRHFDSALLPYAVATVFLAFGVAYRTLVWIGEPPTRQLPRQGLRTLLSHESPHKAPTALPRLAASHLGLRKSHGAPSTAHWPARQVIVWGCSFAALTTPPHPRLPPTPAYRPRQRGPTSQPPGIHHT
ncbi:hypothetical protein [Streptomyces sp. NPDC059649]|uniref:hypothetical protein n=1 Tax=Streptomyces sp. NPDC059649 TaxID=3346895 RepID=UPI0036C3FDF5